MRMTMRRAFLVALVLCVVEGAPEAGAVEKNWNAQEGTWSIPGNWTPGGVPLFNENANVNQGDAQIVTQDAEADILRVGGTVGSLGTVSLLGGKSLTLYHLSVGEGDSGLIVGGAGVGVFKHVSGDLLAAEVALGTAATGRGYYELTHGTLDVSGYLLVGYASGATGMFLVSGADAVVRWGTGGDFPLLKVGQNSSIGTFRQEGGLVYGPGMHIGADVVGGRGVYQLVGGSLNADEQVLVGEECPGVLHVGGGAAELGTLTIAEGPTSGLVTISGTGQLDCDGVTVGLNGTGQMALEGGNLRCGGSTQVGWMSRGTLTQSGGSSSIAWMRIGIENPGSGLVELNGGNMTTTQVDVGVSGSGVFRQTGGMHTVEYSLSVGGIWSGQKGSYYLYGGSLLATNAVVGEESQGQLDQLTGMCQIGETLTLGKYAGSGGTYTLEDGPCLLNNVVVGDSGFGRFQQWGNYVDVAGTLMLANQTGSRGTYFLESGELSADTILAGAGDEAVFILAGSHLEYAGSFGPDLDNTGGVFRPGGASIGDVVFADGASYTQRSGGTLEITVGTFPVTNMDYLSTGGTVELGGMLKTVIPDNWVRVTHTEYRHTPIGGFATASGITGDFTYFRAVHPGGQPWDSDTTSYDPAYGLFGGKGTVVEAQAQCWAVFMGYTVGDCSGDCKVDGGDLALMGAGWGKSDPNWRDGDLNGDGEVDGGDLALLGGNWNWVCLTCYKQGRDGGGRAKFDDGGLDLSDRDGDGDFDVDDMLIIIEEMHKPPSDDSESIDPSGKECAPPPDPSVPGPLIDGPSQGGSPPPPLIVAALDSPLFWAACWIASIAALFRPRRRAG